MFFMAFFNKRKDKVIDLTERYVKEKERIDNIRESMQEDSSSESSAPSSPGIFGMFGGGTPTPSVNTTGDISDAEEKRKRLGNLAIGFPLVDPTVPVQFFTSYACMDKPSEYTLLTPQFPHGPFSENIASARNSLVEQAQKEGAKYLLMLDTDQVYPHDTLTKLMSHKVDVCGVRVHRRWMPFDPIFLRGDIGAYESVPDEEMYSGNLIEIDATGAGCLLFDMEVFDKVQYPWFKLDVQDGKPVGEDIYFCSEARKAGIRIFVDTSIEVGHLTMMEVNRYLHQICKRIKPKKEIRSL